MIAGVPRRLQDRRRLVGALRRIGRDADIERLALAHRRVERAHGLLQRRVGIEAVRIEDVDIVEPHALEALVEAGEQVLAAAPLAIGARPHVVAGLGRDHHLVAMVAEIGLQDGAEQRLGRARRRAVIVGEVEMGDAHVEGGAAHLAGRRRRASRGRNSATGRARSPAASGRCGRCADRAWCRNACRMACRPCLIVSGMEFGGGIGPGAEGNG